MIIVKAYHIQGDMMLLSYIEKYFSASISDLPIREYLVAVLRFEAYMKHCPAYARAVADQIIHKKSPLYFRKTHLTVALFFYEPDGSLLFIS